MSQQIINVGSAPNDGTGDLLRNSQIKANANFTELYNSVVTNTSDLINDGEDGVNPFISLLDLPSNLILYPTTATSDVSGYVKLVTDIHDVDYNTTAVDVTTGSITGTNQLIASLITTAGLIVGNAGVFNTTTIGNIRKTAGAGNAEFYYLIYKRTSLGVETLVGTSNPTIPVNSAVYTQFNTIALWDDGIFDITDRIVLKFYASKVGGGSSPTYDFQFGGTAPVRTLVPVALSVIPTDALSNQITDYTNATLPLTGTENLILNDGTGWKKLTWTNIKAQLKTYFDTLYQSILVSGTNIKTINGTSVLGSGDLVVSGSGGTSNLRPFDMIKVNNGINGVNNYGSGSVALTSSSYANANSLVKGIIFTDIVSSTSSIGSFSLFDYLNYSQITNMPESFTGYLAIGNTILIPDSRCFFGLVKNGYTVNNINPSLACQVGVLNDSTDANLQICYNTGSNVKIDLGSNFPARYTKGQHLYKIRISITSSSTAVVIIKDLVTGFSATHNLTGLVLTYNSSKTLSISLNSNTTAVATRLLFNSLIVEDNYDL